MNETFAHAFNSRKIDNLISRHEPGAVLLTDASGEEYRGFDIIARQLSQLLNVPGVMISANNFCIVHGEIALLRADYQLKNGGTIIMQGGTAEVVRRQSDGSWLYVFDHADVHDRWLRVMVGCTLKMLTRPTTARPKRKVVLLLDEIAALGRLDTLATLSGILRAYCTPVLIWQNLPQIAKVYGEDAKALLANASARVFFGVNDNQTAEYVSTMVGSTTTLSSSTSSTSRSGHTGGKHESRSESGCWLIDPAEVQRLPLTRVIIKFRGVSFSILGRHIDYRKTWRWRG